MRIAWVVGGHRGERSLGVGGYRVKTRSLLGAWSKEIVEGTSFGHCGCMSCN